jgi:hypothetical protein
MTRIVSFKVPVLLMSSELRLLAAHGIDLWRPRWMLDSTGQSRK